MLRLRDGLAPTLFGSFVAAKDFRWTLSGQGTSPVAAPA